MSRRKEGKANKEKWEKERGERNTLINSNIPIILLFNSIPRKENNVSYIQRQKQECYMVRGRETKSMVALKVDANSITEILILSRGQPGRYGNWAQDTYIMLGLSVGDWTDVIRILWCPEEAYANPIWRKASLKYACRFPWLTINQSTSKD